MNIQLAPICLFTFNRLDETKATIEALKKNYLAKQSLLFIFSDGWKTNTQKSKILELRSYLKTVSGFKKVQIIESSTNKGLANSIIDGVTSIIKDYEKVIVLEDDLITSPNFLDFMNSSLLDFRKRKDILSISGHTLKFKLPKNYNSDVYLFGRAASWGWATWKDRWQKIDWQIKDWDNFKNNLSEQKKFNANGSDMSNMLKDYFEGKNNSWAIRFCYNQFKLNMFTVFPVLSKVNNIGFGEDATNCKGYNRFKTELDTTFKTNFDIDVTIKPNKKIIKQIVAYLSLRSRIKSKILNFYYQKIRN